MSTIEQKGNLEGSIAKGGSLAGYAKSKSSLEGKAQGSNRVGTDDYERLQNLPSIESVELKGDKSFEDLGLEECSNLEIDSLFRSIF